MELMITIAIIGLLAAIAFPSYQSHILRTHRVAAASCLAEIAQQMERYYTSNLSYSGATIPTLACITDEVGRYTFAFSTGEPTATTYIINAVPSGAQVKDVGCGTLSFTQAGVKGVTGTDTAPNCWR